MREKALWFLRGTEQEEGDTPPRLEGDRRRRGRRFDGGDREENNQNLQSGYLNLGRLLVDG